MILILLAVFSSNRIPPAYINWLKLHHYNSLGLVVHNVESANVIASVFLREASSANMTIVSNDQIDASQSIDGIASIFRSAMQSKINVFCLIGYVIDPLCRVSRNLSSSRDFTLANFPKILQAGDSAGAFDSGLVWLALPGIIVNSTILPYAQKARFIALSQLTAPDFNPSTPEFVEMVNVYDALPNSSDYIGRAASGKGSLRLVIADGYASMSVLIRSVADLVRAGMVCATQFMQFLF